MTKKAQSEYIGFIIAMIIIVLLLVPLFYILSDYSAPSVKSLDYQEVVDNQINGGSIMIFFNSTPKSSYLEVFRGSDQYVLKAVYYTKGGIWYNITSQIEAFCEINGKKYYVSPSPYLPQPLIYNFTLPQYVWDYSLVLQIEAYNITVFATVYPNETAFT
ncbi:MAG: hypothetical protein OWQ54_10200 [Sulfolobaceae archaeon]|nr:hypothetical protein [Sulfolobaceae archaeon]